MTTQPTPAECAAAAAVIVAAGLTACSTTRNASPKAQQIARDFLAAVGDRARAAGIPASTLDVLQTRLQKHQIPAALRDAERIARAVGPEAVHSIFRPSKGPAS